MNQNFGKTWGDHLQDLTTPTARQWKDDYGCKAGGLKYLAQDPVLAPYILPGFYISPDQIATGNIPELPSEFDKLTGKLIYRSTNPQDGYDFIGGLPTINDRDIPLYTEAARSDEKSNQLQDIDTRLYEQKIGLNIGKNPNRPFVPPHGRGIPGGCDPEIINTIGENLRNKSITEDSVSQKIQELESEKNLLLTDTNKPINIKHHRHLQVIEKIAERIRKSYWGDYLTRRNLTDPQQNTGIYIQEALSIGGMVGSVIEHPNNPGVYAISYMPNNYSSDMHDNGLFMDFINDDGEYLGGYNGHLSHSSQEKVPHYIRTIVALYKKIKQKQFFEDGISFQMEFGTDRYAKPFIFQLRQFRPFEKATWNHTTGKNSLSFGITPEEGVEINYEIRDGIEFCMLLTESVQEGVNGLILNDLKLNIPPVFHMEDLQLFSMGGFSRPNLEHHLYDPAMKVPLVICDSGSLPDSLKYASDGKTGKLLYKSDGIRSSVKRI
ncbi:hypothetical protein KBD33_00600 [Candidatus Gracilibacteria bacterium]|nr:hypothetical protein [Candidatus Gracilibacteria bacterium]